MHLAVFGNVLTVSTLAIFPSLHAFYNQGLEVGQKISEGSTLEDSGFPTPSKCSLSRFFRQLAPWQAAKMAKVENCLHASVQRLARANYRLLRSDPMQQINSLIEDNAMLAENLETWAQRERQEGERIGIRKGERIGMQKGERIGMQKGRQETAQATARNLIALGMLTDGQIAQVTGLTVAQVEALHADK